jgi:hypothetical protein
MAITVHIELPGNYLKVTATGKDDVDQSHLRL